MDARLTSEWSILVSPPRADEPAAGTQLATAYLGIATIVLFWDYGGALGGALLALGILLLVSAVIFNAIAVSQDEKRNVPRYHSVGVINTLIGHTISSGWLRAVVVIANVTAVAVAISAFVIGEQLEAAWGCYSAHLSLSRLTSAPCTINPAPERCWDVTLGRGASEACTGTRHPNTQKAEWGPLVFFVAEWIVVIMLRYKHALASRKHE